jgi:hypothetical protein
MHYGQLVKWQNTDSKLFRSVGDHLFTLTQVLMSYPFGHKLTRLLLDRQQRVLCPASIRPGAHRIHPVQERGGTRGLIFSNYLVSKK